MCVHDVQSLRLYAPFDDQEFAAGPQAVLSLFEDSFD